MKRLFVLPALIVVLAAGQIYAQADLESVEPGRFDQGKMWTFENPPVSYFKEAYNFDATNEWMSDVSKSALRFASFCSASFISPDGLILTNHHCSRDVVVAVMQEGEDFEKNGFYAETLEDERRVPGLYVDQLWLVEDITSKVKGMKGITADSALSAITESYKKLDDWKDLVIETRTFYSGGKYSIYGFKRFEDIRLVLLPEVALGFYGGDPDNFTYPRYNLDFTMFRAYDEQGKPLKPSHYLKFNDSGIQNGEPVFIVGSPGSTGRYLTMSQLAYKRDVEFPTRLELYKVVMEGLQPAIEKAKSLKERDSLVNVTVTLSNSQKAIGGMKEGMHDAVLMTKKSKKEAEVRSKAKISGADPWEEIDKNVKALSPFYPETYLLTPNEYRGKVMLVLHDAYEYHLAAKEGKVEDQNKAKEQILAKLQGMDKEVEQAIFVDFIKALQQKTAQDYLTKWLKGKSVEEALDQVLSKSLLLNDPQAFFEAKAKKQAGDQFVQLAELLVPQYRDAAVRIARMNRLNNVLQEQIMAYQFELTGVSSPPDASFSLRLADGVVKGYEYNGTTAPYYTTYFGMYDRHYSFNEEFPWNLPERWKNPPMELLKQPLNFVCTSDIIGGNSGSPVINRNKELVGLVFDGNIESLPGYFIYDDTYNRSVAVHAGGISAAMKYIYKANRLLKELSVE